MSILVHCWAPRVYASLAKPHFFQYLSNFLILSAFLFPSSQAASSPPGVCYSWQFKVFAIDKNPYTLLNSTFCPTKGCQSLIFLTFDISKACSVNCNMRWDTMSESPKYLCLMSNQTIQCCRDPDWGGCPYWSYYYY
jgi:hypothetical protein